MRRGRSTGSPTKAEAAHLALIKRLGCICCIALGYPHDPDGPVVEAHHLLSGGIRRGHAHTVGLCMWHHRGRLVVSAWSHAMHRRNLGPSLAEGSVPFHRAFGDDDALTSRQQRLIEQNTRKAA